MPRWPFDGQIEQEQPADAGGHDETGITGTRRERLRDWNQVPARDQRKRQQCCSRGEQHDHERRRHRIRGGGDAPRLEDTIRCERPGHVARPGCQRPRCERDRDADDGTQSRATQLHERETGQHPRTPLPSRGREQLAHRCVLGLLHAGWPGLRLRGLNGDRAVGEARIPGHRFQRETREPGRDRKYQRDHERRFDNGRPRNARAVPNCRGGRGDDRGRHDPTPRRRASAPFDHRDDRRADGSACFRAVQAANRPTQPYERRATHVPSLPTAGAPRSNRARRSRTVRNLPAPTDRERAARRGG